MTDDGGYYGEAAAHYAEPLNRRIDPTVPPVRRRRRYTDAEVLSFYSMWSEDRYAASFITPDPATVAKFREWLAVMEKRGPTEDYEREMLAEFRRQEAQQP